MTANDVSGWVFDPEAEARSLDVRLRLGDRILGEGVADLPRRGVAAKLGVSGDHGFRFPLDLAPRQAQRVTVEARVAPDRPWQPIPKAPARRPRQYQSFDDAPGASRSAERLNALELSLLPNGQGPTPLKGLSVLVVGCNEGFFCGEALRQGARRVVGIDANAGFVQRARQRFPQAEFRCGSWWDLPDERFDVILFLSAIHHEPDPAGLLKKLACHLTPTGTLVVECGIAAGAGKAWRWVNRVDGRRRYPTLALFIEEIAAPFAPRMIGSSVPQRGDPAPRRVFHCPLKSTTVLLVIGEPRIGKSTLARQFGRRDIPVLRTDILLSALLREDGFMASPLTATVRRFSEERPVNFARIGVAVAAERPAEFVDFLLQKLPQGHDLICMEGEILRHSSIRDPLMSELRARGLRPWVVTPRHPGTARAFASRVAAALRMVFIRAKINATLAWRALRRATGGSPRP